MNYRRAFGIDSFRIQELYIAFYGRPADPAGAAYWLSASSAELGGDELGLIRIFGSSSQPEFANLYPTGTADAFVSAVYQNLFGRSPEQAGLNYWVGVLNEKIGASIDPNLVRAQMVVSILDNSIGSDASTIFNKVTAATYFTTALNSMAEIASYSSQNPGGVVIARSWLASIGAEEASRSNAVDRIPTTISDILVPLMLPPSIDAVSGKFTLKICNPTSSFAYETINQVKNGEVLEVLAEKPAKLDLDLAKITNGIDEFKLPCAGLSATFINARPDDKFVIAHEIYVSVDVPVSDISIDNMAGRDHINIELEAGNTSFHGGPHLKLVNARDIAISTKAVSQYRGPDLDLTCQDNSKVTVSGDADLVLALEVGNSCSIDGSALNARLSLVFHQTGASSPTPYVPVMNRQIKGTKNADYISVAGDGIDSVIEGGGGNDTFVFNTRFSKTTIKDFAKGDTLEFWGGATFDRHEVDVTTANTVEDALRLAVSSGDSPMETFKWFQFGSDTYVVNNKFVSEMQGQALYEQVKLVGLIDLSNASVSPTPHMTPYLAVRLT